MINNAHNSNKVLVLNYHLVRFIGASLLIILFGSALTFLWREQEHQTWPQSSTHPNTITSHDTTTMRQSTQILLIALGVSVIILLVIPNLLIRQRRPSPVSHTIDLTPPDQMQTRFNQPMTETLSKRAATTEQLQPIFPNQFSPTAKHLASTAASSKQASIQFHPSSGAPALRATTPQSQRLSTPPQHVPATPFIQHVPATPFLHHSTQGGLLTRNNVAGGLPRRIELRYAQQNTSPRQNIPCASRAPSQRREGHISQ
jgi:hypothetical protein